MSATGARILGSEVPLALYDPLPLTEREWRKEGAGRPLHALVSRMGVLSTACALVSALPSLTLALRILHTQIFARVLI